MNISQMLEDEQLLVFIPQKKTQAQQLGPTLLPGKHMWRKTIKTFLTRKMWPEYSYTKLQLHIHDHQDFSKTMQFLANMDHAFTSTLECFLMVSPRFLPKFSSHYAFLLRSSDLVSVSELGLGDQKATTYRAYVSKD